MAKSKGLLLTREAGGSSGQGGAPQFCEEIGLTLRRKLGFQLEGMVKIVLDGPLVAPCDEDEMLDPGLARLVDDILDGWTVKDRKHFLGDRFCSRQYPRPKSRHGQNGFPNGL
jgi:hypothetical protein